MSNYGTGFPGFKTAIEEVTEALGGQHTREAVAKTFEDALTREINARKGERYPRWSGTIWTEATDFDFDGARDKAIRYLTNWREPLKASADWKGGKLEHRGDVIVLHGGPYSLLVAMLGSHDEYDRKANADVRKWRAFIRDDAKRMLDSYFSTSPSSTNAKSGAGGQKSLRKLVETFFKVKFEEVVPA